MVAPLPYEAAPKVGLDRSKTGRAKGTPNKTTKTLKEAILLAARAVGEELNPDDEDGLVGYLKLVAKSDVKAFAALLGRVLPMEVTGSGGGAFEVVFRTVYEDAAPAP